MASHLVGNAYGVTHGRSSTPTYKSWRAMRQRCGVVKGKDSPHYQGVSVCSRWANSFENFLADMGERPEGKTLDRWPDRTGNYEPGNCRWATQAEQQQNTSMTKMLTHSGKTQSQKAWADDLGITPEAINARLKRGLSVEQALTMAKGG